MSRILYPKPLPDPIKETVILESGFTPTEIVALQNCWRLLKRRFYYHSTKIFMEFFNKNDSLLERFRNNLTGKFDLTHLYQHPPQLLNLYGNLIESGLNNVAYINLILNDVSQRHKMFGVSYKEIKLQKLLQNMSHILYPKPLPDLIKETVILESGFTTTEIVALQNGWRLIKRRFYYHSTKIFMEFFNKNDSLLERFRNNLTGKFDLTHLYQHPPQLLNLYGNLIESGLNNMAYINLILNDVSQRHKMFGVSYKEIKLYTDYIAEYITEYLDKLKSTSFIRGLNKLNELINSYHNENRIDEEDNKD